MSNSTVLSVSKVNLDANGIITDQLDVDSIITVPWSQRTGGTATIADTTSSPTYTTLSLGEITTANYIELDSDQALSVKLNGMASSFVCAGWLSMTGTFTAVLVQNSSGLTANVGFDFRAA